MHERAKKPAAVERLHTRETGGARGIDGRQGGDGELGSEFLRRAGGIAPLIGGDTFTLILYLSRKKCDIILS